MNEQPLNHPDFDDTTHNTDGPEGCICAEGFLAIGEVIFRYRLGLGDLAILAASGTQRYATMLVSHWERRVLQVGEKPNLAPASTDGVKNDAGE